MPGFADWLSNTAGAAKDKFLEYSHDIDNYLGLGPAAAAPPRTVQQTTADDIKSQGYPDYVANQPANQGWSYGPNPNNPKNFSGSVYNDGDFQGKLMQFPGPSLPAKMPVQIPIYRADPTNRYGGNNGLETQPTMIGAAELYANARAVARAQNVLGRPMPSAQDLAAMAVKEARPDFGQNEVTIHGPGGRLDFQHYDPNMPGDKAIYDKLMQSGLGDKYAGLPTRIINKQNVAQRLGIPFHEAWNGTGGPGQGTISGGAAYARNFSHSVAAAAHPKNAGLVKFIQDAMDAENTPGPPAGAPPQAQSAWDTMLHTIPGFSTFFGSPAQRFQPPGGASGR